MPLRIGFLKDFCGFGRVKWSPLGTSIEPKTHVNIEMRFKENRALTAVGARILLIRKSKLGAKIEQKSINK